ncbi:hypothetical protein BGW80DRAFT_1287923 [Lactifluus volemus]|nr:hypothetical protein BGW80DRAFT_1287923 [Lactifluus volemus]
MTRLRTNGLATMEGISDVRNVMTLTPTLRSFYDMAFPLVHLIFLSRLPTSPGVGPRLTMQWLREPDNVSRYFPRGTDMKQREDQAKTALVPHSRSVKWPQKAVALDTGGTGDTTDRVKDEPNESLRTGTGRKMRKLHSIATGDGGRDLYDDPLGFDDHQRQNRESKANERTGKAKWGKDSSHHRAMMLMTLLYF